MYQEGQLSLFPEILGILSRFIQYFYLISLLITHLTPCGPCSVILNSGCHSKGQLKSREDVEIERDIGKSLR